MFFINILFIASIVYAGPATESYKDQYCTDPRTMKKHAAYTEWADAYSCSRHRCQPGGRNLAIYTVGCKRVEAPESAIECEEVVEDTNMQFPYCCTRLRCLVVVRGEVWTRVLGQPWETLPAAPWSHMYKMKRPPPSDNTFLPKGGAEGPVYELSSDANNESGRDKVLRSGKKITTEGADCNDIALRAVPAPDIVIALSTNSDTKEHKKKENRHKRVRKTPGQGSALFTEEEQDHNEPEAEEATETPEKTQHQQLSWTEIPQNQWNEHDPSIEPDTNKEGSYHQSDFQPDVEKKEDKPNNLQALVDAIGTRMRDIENVVQRMSDNVQQAKPGEADFDSNEKIAVSDTEVPHKQHKSDSRDHGKEFGKIKRPNSDGHYKRFSVRNRGSKYLHSTTESTTDQPLFVEDTSLNGYFSDASNSVLRRANQPKEPAATYMAPVDNRRKGPAHIAVASDVSDESEKKHKKHSHKKKKTKGHGHKKHHSKDEKRRRTRLSSAEVDKNVISLEDSSAGVSR